MTNRAEKAVGFKRYCNCCQAVLLAFADVLPMTEEQLMALGSGFGSGMGCMKATCGALCGASMVVGLCNPGRPTAMLTRQLLADFEQRCGATICGDLKGIKTGKVLCSCDDCVRNAVLCLEKHVSCSDL